MFQKLLFILLFVSTISYAKVVTITTTGTYKQLEFTKSSPIPDETAYARKQALAFAKEKAVEEAGTTLYVSFSSYANGRGVNRSKNEIKAISSALIKTKILKEGWKENIYSVKVRATVDSKDAEEVFKRADKRLKEIARLQTKNEDLLSDIKKISNKIFSIGRNSHSSSNKLELHKMNSKQKIQYYNQAKLFDEYEENLLLMETKFEKGTLLAIANENEKREDAEFKEAKKAFDNYFTRVFKKDFIAKILNLDVRKHGKTADIHFFIGMMTKEHSGLSHKMKNLFVRERREWNNHSISREYYGYLQFAETPLGKRFANWVRDNRNMAIRIKVGKRSYYTERFVVNTFELNRNDSNKNELKYFRNDDGYMSERIIKNIPLSELAGLDSVVAELVYTKRSIHDKRSGNSYPLPSLREAEEYYEGYDPYKRRR